MVNDRSPLFVAWAELELHFPGARSLKEKRQDLRSLEDRLRHRLPILVVEADYPDLHQRSGLALSALATGESQARGIVAKALELVHQHFPGVVLSERVNVLQLR